MIKFNNYTLKKLENLFSELTYRVIYEKGNFQSGYCIVENKKIVVINKFYDTEGKINVLMDILSTIEMPDTLTDASKKLLSDIEKHNTVEDE